MACSKPENNQTFMGKSSQFETNLKRKDILQNLPVESVGLTLCMDEPLFPCSCGFGSVRTGLAVVLIHWEGEASLKPVREVRPLQTPNPEIKDFRWDLNWCLKSKRFIVHLNTNLCLQLPSQASSRCLAAKRFCSGYKTDQINLFWIIHICIHHSQLFFIASLVMSPLACFSLFLSASRSSLVWLLFTPRAPITSRRARAALVWGRSLAGSR